MNHRSMNPASEPHVLPARFSRRQALGNLALTVSAFALAKPLAGAETGPSGPSVTAKPSSLPVFNVRDFGAGPDGKTLCTAAVQRAIDACGQAGGGTVYVPPGTFLTGTLFLRSNVTLYLEAGATLLGSARIEDYAPQHVLFAKGAQNIALAGPGTVDGQGHAFWEKLDALQEGAKRRLKFAWVPPHRYRHPNNPPVNLIKLEGCTGVKIRDLTLRNSESWTLHLLGCDDVVIDGLRIRNPLHGPNTDGIDLQACQSVHISNCDIYTADDAIVLKNRSRDYLRPCKNITVTNCILTTTCNGFKIGTESFSDFENIVFSNSVIKAGLPDEELAREAATTIDPDHYGNALAPLSGVAVETVDGARLRGVSVNNVVMQDVRAPIFVRLAHRGINPVNRGEKAQPGTLEDVSISNITAHRASCASSITGISGHLVRNVTVTNLRVTNIGGGTRDLAGRELPENESSYPEATAWGQMPCHGLFVRHVAGLLLRNLRFLTEKLDARPALICHDVADLRVDGLELDQEVAADWLIELRDVREAVFRNTIPPRGTRTWVRVAGAKSQGILLLPDALRDVQKPLQLGDGVPADAVLLRPVHQ
jgi:polygalacturonase